MKKALLITATLCICITSLFSQVAINSNGNAADASSMLDVTSTTKGMLIPRMTKSQRDAISLLSIGLLIYQTDNTMGFYYYNGIAWVTIGAEASSINDLSDGRAGNGSIFLGEDAGSNDNLGSINNNVAVGDYALLTNVSGTNNTAVGRSSLFFNTGDDNSAFGSGALNFNTTGNRNCAFGNLALSANTIGIGNLALGTTALYYNTSGHYNVCVGNSASYNNQTGSYNTVFGAGAGYTNTSGSANIFLGYKAGFNETGSNKLYIENSDIISPLIYGEFDNNLLRINGTLNINSQYSFPTTDGNNNQILKTNGSGSLTWSDDTNTGATDINGLIDGKIGGNSVFLGSGAGTNDDGTNNQNVAVGINALNTNTTGSSNTSVGYLALNKNTTAAHNIAIGSKALYTQSFNNSGSEWNSWNIAIGDSALFSNQPFMVGTGIENIAIGHNSLKKNTYGSNNTAIGQNTLFENTSGVNNVAIGSNSLFHNQNGGANISLGDYSLHQNTSGAYNTSIGVNSLNKNTGGGNNIAMAYNALFSNISGNNNIGIGKNTNYYCTTGSNNTIIGHEAGYGTATNHKSGSVFLGYQAGYNEHSSNKLYIENSNSTSPLIYGDFNSDFVTINGRLGIGNTAGTNTKLNVSHNDLYAGKFTSDYANSSTRVVYAEYNGILTADATAVYGAAQPNANQNYGLGGQFWGNYMGVKAVSEAGTSTGSTYGIYATSTGTAGSRTGVFGSVNGSATNRYGVYGSAEAVTNSYAMYCDGNGVYTGTWSQSSDRKLKKNIEPMQNALEKLLQLQPSTYDYRIDEFGFMNLSEGKQLGFVAQDMETVFPELVSTVAHPKSHGKETDIEQYKAINYIGLIPVLTEAIKEQQQIIDALQNKLELVEQKLIQLESVK